MSNTKPDRVVLYRPLTPGDPNLIRAGTAFIGDAWIEVYPLQDHAFNYTFLELWLGTPEFQGAELVASLNLSDDGAQQIDRTWERANRFMSALGFHPSGVTKSFAVWLFERTGKHV